MDKIVLARACFGALPYFEAAARTRSFTAAAKEFRVSQPAISKRIMELEASLSCQLFERKNNRLSLTRSGDNLYQSLQVGYGPITKSLVEVAEARSRRSLKMVCGFSFASMWLQPRFEQLREHLGGIDLQLIVSERPDNLDPDDVDIRITWRPDPWKGRKMQAVFPEALSLVCSPGFAEEYNLDVSQDLSAAQLRDLPLIFYDLGSEASCDWPTWFERAGDSVDPAFSGYTYTNYMYAMQAAMLGKGIAIGFLPMIKGNLAIGDLVRLGSVVHHRETAVFFEYAPETVKPSLVKKLNAWFQSER